MAQLSDDELREVDAYFRAANYLTVGQIYLQANPLLREPLRAEHIKPRLLGHWGTSPGLNLVYAHLNRVIRARGSRVLFLAGPGHGGPAVLANVYLEGTYSEVYPQITRDERRACGGLFRQFSTPGGVPSHVGPPTPGSIHEGGELGYVLTHAFGAVFDNPDLVAVAVVGDGEAETGPLEGSWKGVSFLNPARDGAVLPDPAPQRLQDLRAHGPRARERRGDPQPARGPRLRRPLRRGRRPDDACTARSRDALDACWSNDPRDPARRRAPARLAGRRRAGRLIVLRTPKGWTGPKASTACRSRGPSARTRCRSPTCATNPAHLAHARSVDEELPAREALRRPRAPRPELAALAPEGDAPHGREPARERRASSRSRSTSRLHRLRGRRSRARRRSTTSRRAQLGADAARHLRARTRTNFRLFCPDETNSNRLGAVFEVENALPRGADLRRRRPRRRRTGA